MLKFALPSQGLLANPDSVMDSVLQHQMSVNPSIPHSHSHPTGPGLPPFDSETTHESGTNLDQLKKSSNTERLPSSEVLKSPVSKQAQESSSSNISPTPALASIEEPPEAPIKNQVTFRKIYMVFVMLVLLRLFNLAFISSTTQPSLPFLSNPVFVAATDYNFQASSSNIDLLTAHPDIKPPSWSFMTSILDTSISLSKGITLMIVDFLSLHSLILLSYETWIVISLTLALHPFAAWADEVVHEYFYDRVQHKNIHQLPDWTYNFGKKGFKYIRYFIMALAIWPFSEPLSRDANLILVISTVWMSLVKRVLKMLVNILHIRSALRPANERFPRGLYYGGFPSGHVSQAMVGVVVVHYIWGVNNILAYALIFQLLLTTLWVVISNRHYISQVFAGTALGIVYGFAAIAWLQGTYGMNISAPATGWSLL